MKKICVVILLILLCGCVSAPKPTDNFIAELPKNKSEQIVYKNGLSHWARAGSVWGKDAYVVEENRFGHDTTTITVKRFANDLPNLKPFFIVELAELPNGQTRVEVKEGPCAINCYQNFTPDVRKWLKP